MPRNSRGYETDDCGPARQSPRGEGFRVFTNGRYRRRHAQFTFTAVNREVRSTANIRGKRRGSAESGRWYASRSAEAQI
jgi:hypothetical protein